MKKFGSFERDTGPERRGAIVYLPLNPVQLTKTKQRKPKIVSAISIGCQVVRGADRSFIAADTDARKQRSPMPKYMRGAY